MAYRVQLLYIIFANNMVLFSYAFNVTDENSEPSFVRQAYFNN